jgi:cysteine-rich repeat protein
MSAMRERPSTATRPIRVLLALVLGACSSGCGTDSTCPDGQLEGNDGACVEPGCGNGIKEAGESCDDGNQDDNDGCTSLCRPGGLCGNGILDETVGEQCDDTNQILHDGCDDICVLEEPTFTMLTPAGDLPTPRAGHAMAYDAERDEHILFGGEDATGVLADTWRWNGDAWARLAPASAPTPRRDHRMVYDASSKELLLVGGFDGSGTALDDVWSWTGESWVALDEQPAPPARGLHQMAYDDDTDSLLLFGGLDGAGGSPLGDMWSHDADGWHAVTPSPLPPARARHAMSYDQRLAVVVLYGGEGEAGALQDTWVFDGSSWTEMSDVPAPLAGPLAVAAFHGARYRVDLFSEQVDDPADAVGSWTGARWRKSDSIAQVSQSNGFTVSYDSARLESIIFGGETDGTLSNTTWSYRYE